MAKQLNVSLGFTADTSQAKKQLQDLQNSLTQLATKPIKFGGDNMVKDIQKASSAVAELKVHLQQATNMNTGILDFSKLNQSIKQSGTSLSDYGAILNSMGPEGKKAFMMLSQSVSQAEIPIKRSNALLGEMWTSLKNTARWQISSSILHEFIGAIQSAYGYAQDLNESLNNIRIVTGQSIDQMSKFAEEANRAAKALSTTTTEYTNASLIFYQQGLLDDEVKKRTDVTIKMANVTGQSAEVISEQLTAVWNNFYDGSKSLEYYADVMTALGAATASSSDEIAGGLEKFAAVGETIGLSYEYAAAALATITSNTRQSEEVVGTALKTIFARIQGLKLGETLDDGTTLNKYSEALDSVGISIFNQAGELKKMDDILDEMGGKWDALSKAQQTALAQTVAGTRQYTQLVSLMENWDKGDSDSMMANLDTAYNASGTTQEQQEMYAESWEAARDRVQAALEDIYDTIIDDKAFIKLLNSVEKVISYFDNLIDTMGGLGGVVTTLGAVFTKMFSAQLSKSLVDLSYNFKMMTASGREAIQQEKSDTIKEFGSLMADDTQTGIAGETAKNVYTDQLEVQSQLIDNQSRMTELEKERTKILMDQLKLYGEQSIEAAKVVEEKEEERADARKKLQVNAAKEAQSKGKEYDFKETTKKIDNIKVSAESQEIVRKSLKDLQAESISTEQAIAKIGNAIKAIDSQDPDILLEDDKKALNSLLYDLEASPEKFEQISAEIEAIMNRAVGATKISGQDFGLGTEEELDAYVQSVQGVQVANYDLEEANEATSKSFQGVQKSITDSKGPQISWADQIVECANVAMSFTSALQMMGGMMDTLKDPDVSGWDKFISVFSTLAMTIPMVVSVFKGLKSIMEKDTIATGLNTVAKWINALASKGQADDADTAEKEIKEETEAINKNTVAITANAAVKKTIGKDGKTYYSQGGKRISKEVGEKLLKEGGEEVVEEAGEKVVGKGLKGSLKNLGGSLKNIGGGLKAVGKAALNLGKSFGVTFAFVAAGAVMISTSIKLWNKDAEAAEKAAEAAESASKNAEAARQAYSDFKQSLDGYKSAKDGLDSLTQGTAEFRQGVLDANEEALKLINTVEGLEYSINKETGLIEIDEASLEKAQNQKLDQMENAQTSAMILNQKAKDADLKAKQTDFNRDVAKDKGGVSGDDWTAALGTAGAGAATGAIIGTIIPGIGNAVGAAVGGAIGLVAGAITGLVGSVAANKDQTEYEQDAMSAIADYYGKNGDAAFTEKGMQEALANAGLEVDDSFIQSLLANESATKELVTAMHANTQANELLNQQLATQAMTNNEAVQNSDYKEDIIDIAASSMDEEMQAARDKLDEEGWGTEGISKATKVNDQAEEIFKQYAEAAGLDLDSVELTDTKGTDKNREFVYKDAEGEEQTVTLESMKDVVAAAQAQDAVNQKGTDLAEIFNKLDPNQVDVAKAAMTGDYNSLTMDQVQNGIDASKMGLSQEDLNKMGYANLEEYQAALDKLTAEAQTAMEGIELTGLDPEVLGNLSVETAKNIQKTMEEINLGPLGEEGGKQYLEGLNTMVKDLDPEKQQEALAQLNNIDWSSWDAMEQADKIMKEFGVDIDTSSQEWKDFANQMRAANGAIPDFSQMVSTLSEVNGILNKLDFGSVISEEDYNKLMSYNDEWERYFVLQADGTRQFIGNAEDMKRATQEDIKAQREQLEARKAAQAGFDKAGWGHSEGDAWVKADWANKKGSDTGTAQNLLNAGGATEDMLEMLGYDDEVLSGILDKAKNGTEEEIAAAQAQLEEMYKRIAEFQNEDLDLESDKLDEMMASTATSVAELTGMLDDGQISAEAYDKQLTVLAQNASSLDELKEIQAAGIAEGQGLDTGEYGEALVKLAENFSNCSDEIEEYNKALLSGNEKTIQAAQDALELSISAGELAEKYDLNADEVEDYAKRLQKLNKNQKLSGSEATRLATANMRLDRGLENLNDNLDDYKKALKSTNKGSAEWSKTLSDLKTDLADVVNIADGDMLSDTFAEAVVNSEDLKLAMDGNVDAILRLRLAAADDIIANLDIEGEENIKTVQDNWQYLKDNMAANIAAGNVDQTALITSFNEMIKAGNMTKEEIEAALSGLNVSANVKTTYVEQETEVPTTITEEYVEEAGSHPVVYAYDEDGNPLTKDLPLTRKYTNTYSGTPVKVMGHIPQYSIEGTEGEGGITTAFSAASPPKASYSSTTSGGSGGGGGGGGSGSSSKPKKAEKKKKTDVVERYKKIEDKLDDVRDAQDKASKSADRLYGAARLKQMQKINQALAEEVELLKDKKAEAEAYLKVDRQELDKVAKENGISFVYDEKGNISNYEEEMTKLWNELNNAIESANADGDATEEEQEKIDEIQERIDTIKEALGQYEETRELIEDIESELQDKIYEIQDNNFEQLNYELEIKMEISGNSLEWIEYQLEKLEDDFYRAAEAAALLVGIVNNGNLDTRGSQYEAIKSQKEINEKYFADAENKYKVDKDKDGNSIIAQSHFIEALKTSREAAYEQLSALNELDDAMMNYYGDTLEKAMEELAKYTDQMDHLNSVLDHYSSLMSIMGKEKDYKSMGVILRGQVKLAEDRLAAAEATFNMLTSEKDEAYTKWQTALENGNAAAAELYEKEYRAALEKANEAEEEFLESAEETLEAWKAELENALNEMGDNLEKALSGGKGFDWITSTLERMNSLHEEYLTTTNKIYETNKLINKMQQEIDKTSNTVAKRKFKELINSTKQMSEQTSLSKFELEIQQAKYELLLAEIALEEAQNAKSQVRLQRDSEGNFGYVYTADESKIADAQQQYQDAENNLYNISLEGANRYIGQLSQLRQEFVETMRDLEQQWLEGSFTSTEEYQTAQIEAQEFYYEKMRQVSELYYIAIGADSKAAAESLLGDQNLLYNESFTSFSGIAEEWKKIHKDMLSDSDTWKIEVGKYVDGVIGKFNEWDSLCKTISEKTHLDNLAGKVQDIVKESENLVTELTKKDGVLESLDEELQKVKDITSAYALQRQAVKDLIIEIENYIIALNEKQKAEAEENAKKQNSEPTTSSPTTPSTNPTNTEKPSLTIGSSVSVKPGTKWHYDSYGTAPCGTARGGKILYINSKSGATHPYNIEGLGWIKKSDIVGYDTGGYTGEWGSYGKLGILHEKELILNKDDTKNWLSSIQEINKTLELYEKNLQMETRLRSYRLNNQKQELQQIVTIEASFPGITEHNELELAFSNLVNEASQYAYRYHK